MSLRCEACSDPEKPRPSDRYRAGLQKSCREDRSVWKVVWWPRSGSSNPPVSRVTRTSRQRTLHLRTAPQPRQVLAGEDGRGSRSSRIASWIESFEATMLLPKSDPSPPRMSVMRPPASSPGLHRWRPGHSMHPGNSACTEWQISKQKVSIAQQVHRRWPRKECCSAADHQQCGQHPYPPFRAPGIRHTLNQ